MRKFIISLFIILSLLTVIVLKATQERILLTVPESLPNNVNYRTERIILQEDDLGTVSVDEGSITIQLAGVERPSAVTCIYNSSSNPTGTFLLVALNKSNLSSAYAANATTGSLKQRIFHRLVVMGEAPVICGKSLAGSLTGNPQ